MTIKHDQETVSNSLFYRAYSNILKGKNFKNKREKENIKKLSKEAEKEFMDNKFKEIGLIRLETIKKVENLEKSDDNTSNFKQILELKNLENDQLRKIIQKLNKELEYKENIIENSVRYQDLKNISITSRDDNSMYFNKTTAIRKHPHNGDDEIYEDEEEKKNSYCQNLRVQSYIWQENERNLIICDDEFFKINLFKECSKISQYFDVILSIKNKTNEPISKVCIDFENSESN